MSAVFLGLSWPKWRMCLAELWVGVVTQLLPQRGWAGWSLPGCIVGVGLALPELQRWNCRLLFLGDTLHGIRASLDLGIIL